MTELQLGLLAIGAVVVAGLFAYNRIEERKARRSAQQAFASGHDDVLLGASPAEAQRAPSAQATRAEPPRYRRLPDPTIDYVIALGLKAPPLPATLEEHWQPVLRRHSPRALLAPEPDALHWHAALQLVSRDGVVGEAELIEFRAAVETVAASLQATVSAPEMKAAMERARALDELCAETDIQVVLHVVPPKGGAVEGSLLAEAATAGGLELEADGRFVLRSAEGMAVCTLGTREGAPFSAATLAGGQFGALSLSLDLPHAPETGRAFEGMARLANHLAAACGGSLVDDNGNALGEAAVAAIAVQLEQVRGAMEAQGVAPGSALAARLYS